MRGALAEAKTVDMDDLDKGIINEIQNTFPLTERPWLELAKRLQTTEDEVLVRVRRLASKGIIRKIGVVVNGRRLGLESSTLIALKVPESRIGKVAEIINSYPGVSHNYQREHEYNLWFTLTAKSRGELSKILEEIGNRCGLNGGDYLNLPTKRLFKLNVQFHAR